MDHVKIVFVDVEGNEQVDIYDVIVNENVEVDYRRNNLTDMKEKIVSIILKIVYVKEGLNAKGNEETCNID